jgi:tight adherence protein B
MIPDNLTGFLSGIDGVVWAGIAAGAAVLLIVVSVYYLFEAKLWSQRMQRYVGSASRADLAEAEARGVKSDPELVQAMNRRIGKLSFAPRMGLELARGGLKITVQQWILLRLGAVTALATLGFVLGNRESPVTAIIMGALLGAIGYFLPRLYLSMRQKRRAEALERQLSDAIDVMAGALEAGSSLPQSLLLVSQGMQPPISEEFSRVVRQVELGLTLEDALVQMSDRITSDDVAMLVIAVNIQYRVGGNLARVLRTIGSTIRDRVKVKGDVRVLTSQQKLSGYVIGLLPFGVGVMMYFINPAYVSKLLDPGLMRLVAVAALAMMTAGFLVLRKLVDIEV